MSGPKNDGKEKQPKPKRTGHADAKKSPRKKRAPKRSSKASPAAAKSAAKPKAAAAAAAETASGDPSWSPNHLECVYTRAFLKSNRQLDADFADSGTIRMRELRFWNLAGSDSARKLEAQFLAGAADDFFRKALLAAFEASVDFDTAHTGMTNALLDAESSVAALARVVDALYRFKGEA